MKAKMVTSLAATPSWNLVPRNKQTPNTDKVVMESCIPIFTALLPTRAGGFEFYRLLEFPHTVFFCLFIFYRDVLKDAGRYCPSQNEFCLCLAMKTVIDIFLGCAFIWTDRLKQKSVSHHVVCAANWWVRLCSPVSVRLPGEAFPVMNFFYGNFSS